MLVLNNITWNSKQFTLSIPYIEFKEHHHAMLMGPSGSGKTSLLSIIAGILKPHHGSVYVDGSDITNIPLEQRGFSIIYQEPSLFPHMSVFDNIAYGLKMRKIQAHHITRKVASVMELCGVSHLGKRFPGTLSGGEKQRVAFARAIVTSPRLLIMDEPFTSLDPVSKDEIIAILLRIKNEYTPTIIHVTHDFDETLALGDYLYVMRNGNVVQHGSVMDVYRFPHDLFVAKLAGIKNIYRGTIVNKKGGAYFVTEKGCLFFLGDSYSKNCHHAVIRAEDIVLAKHMQKSSATNQYRGTVVDITEMRGLYKISIDIGEILQSVITRRSLMELSIKKGAKVVVIFKGTAIHLF